MTDDYDQFLHEAEIDDLRNELADLRGRTVRAGIKSLDRQMRLRDALRNCVLAMKRSAEEGSTDHRLQSTHSGRWTHLDCCEDGGDFWHKAIEDAEALLKD